MGKSDIEDRETLGPLGYVPSYLGFQRRMRVRWMWVADLFMIGAAILLLRAGHLTPFFRLFWIAVILASGIEAINSGIRHYRDVVEERGGRADVSNRP